jgi:deoxyribodipyrimidine photolyase-related protein
MRTLILFPHQCFVAQWVQQTVQENKIQRVLLWEDPVFYGDRKGAPGVQQVRLNKLRLSFQYVLTRTALASWQKHVTVPCDLREVDALWGRTDVYADWKAATEVWIVDPLDHLLNARLRKAGVHPHVLESPSFLMSRDQLAAYQKKHKSLRHAPFYNYAKEQLRLLEGVPNLDSFNRSPFPRNATLPPSPLQRRNAVPFPIWEDAAAWVNNHPQFRKNPGKVNMDVLKYMATTPQEAEEWLKTFLQQRFASFGTYEDAMVPASPWLYHSGLAVYLNHGLLTPAVVLQKVQQTFRRLNKSEQSKALASYEGFVRQLVGWREFTRLYYLTVPPKVYRRNLFGMTNRPLARAWYEGTTGIPVVDRTIEDAWNTGYLHHIRRLMVISNYMTLCEIHPDRLYQWMYEFSLDSWDWVMVFNCYSMGAWSDGGTSMRKPYISSAAYVKRMAREPSGPWEKEWNARWEHFKKKHRDILRHTQLAAHL